MNFVEASSTTQHYGQYKCANSSRSVDDNTTCEVQDTHLIEPSSTPDPVCDWIEDEDLPEDAEDEEAFDFESLGDCASEEQGSDAREHHLEHRKGGCWKLVGGLAREAAVVGYVEEKGILEVADDSSFVFAVDQREAEQVPHDGEKDESTDGLCHNGDGVLAAQKTGFEKTQTGHHAQHEHGRDQHPRRVSGVVARSGAATIGIGCHEQTQHLEAFVVVEVVVR